MNKEIIHIVGQTVYIFDVGRNLVLEAVITRFDRDNGHLTLNLKLKNGEGVVPNVEPEQVFSTFDECLDDAMIYLRKDIEERSKNNYSIDE